MDTALHARVTGYIFGFRLCGWINVAADMAALLRAAEGKAPEDDRPAPELVVVPRWSKPK